MTTSFKGGNIQATGGHFMNVFDIDYNKKEKDLFKYHYTCLLSELFILNYIYFLGFLYFLTFLTIIV